MGKLLWYIALFVLPLTIRAQIITNFAGGGTGGDGGPATSASINDPNGLVFDKYGNLYFATNVGNQVRKIDTFGIITTIAGTGIAGFSGDGGLANLAILDQPVSLAFDSAGNLYIADAANNRIRKITLSTGIITTIAGNLSPCCTSVGNYNGDGEMATLSTLNLPSGICFDKNDNLYIADNANNRVRKVSTSGVITTVAGNGMVGYVGGTLATAAKCGPPNSLCFDDIGNLYISGYGVIMKMNTSGIITTIAGEDTTAGSYWAYNGDNIPATAARIAPGMIAINSGSLYIADELNYRIRMIDNSGIIHTVACNGINGNSGDNGPADSAETSNPYGIAFDHCGNLYFSQDDFPRIRKVTYNPPPCPYLSINTIKEEQLNIYPNPTYAQLNIDNLKPPATYRLLSIVGATMQQGILKEGNNSISIQALPSGMYMLELIDEQNNRTANKIVKQ